MTGLSRAAIDRRSVAIGLAAVAATGGASQAQLAGLEVLAAGPPGDGQDQLARAIAEGLALTKLTPRAMPVNVARAADAISDFVSGKRSRAALMIVGLSTVGSLQSASATADLDRARPLCRILGEHLPIVAPAGSGLRSMGQLVDLIRKDAGAVRWAGRPLGSADHLLCLRVTKAAGGDLSRLSYAPFATSAEASNSVLRGEVAVGVGALIEFAQQIRGGTLRALALGSPQRVADFDVPTLGETGLDVALLNWRGVITRNAVGRALIDRYGEAIARVVRTPGWDNLMKQRYWVDLYQPADEFAQYLAAERKSVAETLAGVASAR